MTTLCEWSDIIIQGYSFKFHGRAPGLTEVDMKWATKLSPAKMEVIRKEVQSLVSKGAMRKVPMSEARKKKGFYSKMFCVPKPGGKWRPIIDLRCLNEYIKKETFKMDTIVSKAGAGARGLCCINRPERCLLSCWDT